MFTPWILCHGFSQFRWYKLIPFFTKSFYLQWWYSTSNKAVFSGFGWFPYTSRIKKYSFRMMRTQDSSVLGTWISWFHFLVPDKSLRPSKASRFFPAFSHWWVSSNVQTGSRPLEPLHRFNSKFKQAESYMTLEGNQKDLRWKRIIHRGNSKQ